jgi:hypothetical protein
MVLVINNFLRSRVRWICLNRTARNQTFPLPAFLFGQSTKGCPAIMRPEGRKSLELVRIRVYNLSLVVQFRCLRWLIG